MVAVPRLLRLGGAGLGKARALRCMVAVPRLLGRGRARRGRARHGEAGQGKVKPTD
jgi:hypothetical protein